MRTLIAAAALLAAAGSAPAQDWGGFYGGVTAGTDSGEMQYFVNFGTPDTVEDIDGTRLGLFGGYNIVRGGLVYGGEIGYSTGDTGYAPDYGFTRFLDLKARLGRATGGVLLYGTLGWTVGDWKEEGFPALRADGPVFGFGIDVPVSERVFLGAEYLWRQVESENFPAPVAGTDVAGDFGTLSVRAGLRF